MSKVVYVGWLRDWLCDNGDIITAYDLGRDGGADLIVRNNKSDIIGLVTCDDGEMYAECAKALDNGDLSSADAALDGWENGFGSSPFDRDYLPDSVEVIG